ncbi:MAG TPA: diacylglycerol kinase family protein [Ktedonobacteraceae bacterium]|nr:diacylglycerol kinase family protein [Ktedonobacteraceae bacterium]
METASPSTRNAVVILNPAANRGKMEYHRSIVQERAQKERAHYVETTQAWQAKEFALEAARKDRPIVVVGGDGTVHEVVNGILAAGRRVPLGIVAAGSGNDFAWNTLRLPRDPVQAVERAFHGQSVDVDAGRVNERYFVNSFSVGLDADIAVAANRLKKYPLMSGSRLYYISTLKQLLFGYHRCPWLSFTLDGGEQAPDCQKQEGRYVLLAVTNGPTYGAGFRINPSADHTDGLFDVCFIRYTSLLRALQLLPVVQKGQHQEKHVPEIGCCRAKVVHIESQKPVNAQMDGETFCAIRFDAEILMGALCVRI